jgi:polar amino acid transport system substrate-binding protein
MIVYVISINLVKWRGKLPNNIILLFLIVFSLNLYAEETWKIASLNWQPYAGEDLENQGSSIQKLRDILKKEDIKLIVEFYPWNRSKALVANNKEYIGVFPAWTDGVFDGAIISPSVDWSKISILKLSENIVSFKSIDELFEKYSVGVVETYVYPKEISDAMEKYPHNVEGASNEVTLLKKLSIGRGIVAITDPKVMLYLAEKEGISNIEIVSTIMNNELVVALRDDDENRKRLKLLVKLLKKQESE